MIRSTNYIVTEDITLSSVLLTLGVPLQSQAVKIDANGREKYVFLFEDGNEDGSARTADVIAKWGDSSYPGEGEEEPLAFMKVAHFNREAILDEIKQDIGFSEVVDDCGRIALIRKSSAPEYVEALLSN